MTDLSLNILLIEDDPGDAYLLQTLLTRTEHVTFHLEYADRLATALEYLDHHDFDLMLLDLSLPDSTGIETIAKVLAHAPDVPIVVLTGFDNEETAMQAVQAGAQDYLSKDHVDDNMLTRSIRYAVERHRLHIDLAKAQRQEEESLKKAYDELETRVQERTAELQQANAHLQAANHSLDELTQKEADA